MTLVLRHALALRLAAAQLGFEREGPGSQRGVVGSGAAGERENATQIARLPYRLTLDVEGAVRLPSGLRWSGFLREPEGAEEAHLQTTSAAGFMVLFFWSTSDSYFAASAFSRSSISPMSVE